MDNRTRTEKDFYTIQYDAFPCIQGTITFHYPDLTEFIKHDYDWYIIVALEKADKVKSDRHLLTRELILEYRWAIREGFRHGLDPDLKCKFDHPRNQNTIKGIQGYINRITKLSGQPLKNVH